MIPKNFSEIIGFNLDNVLSKISSLEIILMSNYHKARNIKSLLSIIIFLSFYRSPYILFDGRFFAEEGKYFAYAWKNGFLVDYFYRR